MLTKKIYAARKFPTPITFLMVCPQISQRESPLFTVELGLNE